MLDYADTLRRRLTVARAAKLDSLDAALSSRLGSMKSMQRGQSPNGTVAISSINTAKSWLSFVGAKINDTTVDARTMQYNGEITSATQLTIRDMWGPAGTSFASWEVTEHN